MTIRPGQPFWTGLWAAAANMVGLYGVDQIDITAFRLTVTWAAALSLSGFVFIAVYAKAKVDEVANTPDEEQK